jgi:hypothetical protein
VKAGLITPTLREAVFEPGRAEAAYEPPVV